MINSESLFRPVFLMYCIWNGLLLINATLIVDTNSLVQKFGQELFQQFAAIYVVFGLSIFTIGAVFSWLLENKGKVWAGWCFITFCGWRAAGAFWGAAYSQSGFVIETNSVFSSAKMVIFGLVWIFLMLMEWRFLKKTVEE